jgi:hypothetical protein
MTVADAVARLTPICLSGYTHPDYARTVELATLYRKLATGDIGTLLQRFSRREDEHQFATRKQMTIETVSASWNQLRTPFYETARLRGGTITKRFDYEEAVPATEADRRRARLTQVCEAYFNRKPIEHYLAEQLTKSHCMSDPNAWLLTEFAPFDFRTQVAQPYPVLVPCEAAIDFTRSGGVTTSFTGRFSIRQSATKYRYICYLDNEAVDCWPVLWDGQTPVYTLPEGSAVAGEIREVGMNDVEGRVLYQYRLLTHRAGMVPAHVLGYVVDEAGTGDSFISPLHAAIPFLIGMLKVGSENDIVMAQMAFPVRAAYARDCPGAGQDSLGVNHTCINGLDTSNLSRCTVCNGEGTLPFPITAAETATMPMPKPGDEVRVKPQDLVAFISPPTDNPKLQLEYLQSRRLLAMQAVHGTEDADRVAGDQTATQRRIQQQAQKTALAPSADQFSNLYVHAATVSAGYTDTQQGLSVVYEFPPDLELTGEEDLYELRKAAVDAGADASTLEAIDNRIATKQFADDPDALVKNQVKRRFMPFLGRSDDAVNALYALGGCSKYNWVARTSADIIFGELEVEVPGFYQLAYTAQIPLVDAKIKQLLEGLPSATAALPRLSLNPTLAS